MASSYPDPESQIGGASGLYVHHNGTPPAQQQQQQQHIHTDPDLQMHENIQQLRQSNEMMQPTGPHVPHLAQMGPALNPAQHHFQTPPRPTHSPQQMAQSVMSLEEHNPYGEHDASSRKRSKVSRACDECRRKKIRCDATSENGPEACSSCKRTGARCQFSRQPMKRGPSKGYIKELADRLNSLENQIQHPHAPSQSYDFGGVADQNMGDVQTPTQFAKKRTHSMSESFQDSYNRPSWSGQDRDFPPNGNASSINRRTSFGEMTLDGSLITGSNEGAIKAYYRIIHPTLPLLSPLPESSTLNRLAHCPPKLREAFFLSLECCVRSVASRALPPLELSLNQLLALCDDAVHDAKRTLNDSDSSRQLHNNVVFGQSLMFLTLAADRPGPGTVTNASQLLGQLVGHLDDVGLNDSKVLNILRERDGELFQDSRRLFWVAFIFDRFHAASKSKNITLPLHSGSISRDDYQALDEVGYHLTRAADIVGQVAYTNSAGSVPNIDPSYPYAFSALKAQSPFSLAMDGQLSRFRESIEVANISSKPDSPPHLAYQYLRILVARLVSQTSSNELLVLTKAFLSNLAIGSITPLHHIFASLIATSLTELSDRVETQVEAHASIKEMSDALSNDQIIHRSGDNLGWDMAILDLLQQKKAPTPPATGPERTSPADQPNMAGLQHLAAAAVGEREGTDARPPSSEGNRTLTSSQPLKVEHDLEAAVAAANEAAKAQATAAAAQQEMQSASTNGNGNGGNNDPSAFEKNGFL